MAMGTGKQQERQEGLWIAAAGLPRAAGHPFYERLNGLLEEAGFDGFVEERCRRFYAPRMGRPSLAPGMYFRLLLIGYFEGLDSERGMAWRAADSLGLRRFLRIGLEEAPPDHSIPQGGTDAAADRRGNAPGSVHVGAGGAGAERLAAGQDAGGGRDDAGSERGVAEYRATRQRGGLPGVSDQAGAGIGDRDADAGRPGAAGPEAEEEGIEPGWGQPARPRRA